MIRVHKLSKHYRVYARREGLWGSFRDLFNRDYRTLKAVDEISFSIPAGEVLGYIGPNGAGKSTSIKMLTGILAPTSGDLEVFGFHPFRDRKRYTRHIGVVFGQRTQLWWDIAVRESFTLLARIYQIPRPTFMRQLEKLVEIFDLKEFLHQPVRKLSLGQRIRCDLAASLLHEPGVLFLDEPTIGLDAVIKHNVRAFLRTINRDLSTTIILTTHDLAEIEELCNRIIVIDHGKIIYDGSLSGIKALPGLGRRVILDFAGSARLDELTHHFDGAVSFQAQGERRVVASFDPRSVSPVQFVQDVMNRYEIVDLTITEPTIEEVVMKVYREGVNPGGVM